MLWGILFASLFSFSSNATVLDEQFRISLEKMLANVSPDGTAPGTVIASPSRNDPDYYFHWVRDAALIMDTLADVGNFAEFGNFVNLTKTHQTRSGSNLGEPKYEVDGRPFTGPWGRPQNDGPALRASAMIRYANYLIETGYEEYVRRELYDSIQPSHTPIKIDLEYVSANWHRDNFDLWEEIRGDHFYTRSAMYQALMDGAQLAYKLGDAGAGSWYESQADQLAWRLQEHFRNLEYIRENLNRTEGIDYKTSGLDTASILAVLHSPRVQAFIALDDPRMLKTAKLLEKSFFEIYPINKSSNGNIAPAIGRYPEDRYFGGNPWFITTLALAEYYYRLSNLLSYKGQDKGAALTFEKAEGFMLRTAFHIGRKGQMDEQIHRSSGYMVSAIDLTWSYSAFITAYLSREKARASLVAIPPEIK